MKLSVAKITMKLQYFNVKRTIWLKGYQNGNHIEPSEITAAKNKHCKKVT